jgi:hypothetical protein
MDPTPIGEFRCGPHPHESGLTENPARSFALGILASRSKDRFGDIAQIVPFSLHSALMEERRRTFGYRCNHQWRE